MDEIIFNDKTQMPVENELMKALGRVAKLWDKMLSYLESEFDPFTYEWRFYTKNSGWVIKTIHKKRTILYMRPHKASFLVSFVYGDKAVKAANESDLPESLIKQINEAKKYMEGRGVRVEVKRDEDLKIVRKLIKIKMEN